MKTADLKKHPLEKLLELYSHEAQQYRAATALKDDNDAENHAAEVRRIYHEVEARGKNAQNALLAMLEHDDPAIRLWTATHALNFAPGLGKPVLEKLAKGSGFLSHDAQEALRQWHGTHRQNKS